MLRYRAAIAGAIVCAFISAGSMGAGLIAIQPVLNTLLSGRSGGLPELARNFNQNLDHAAA